MLAHRVEDTHTRKAAVELEGLREALKRAGYKQTPVPMARPVTPRATVAQSVGRVWQEVRERSWRQMRELRVDRLAPAQRLTQQMAQSFRRWLGLGVRIEPPTVTVRETQRPQMTVRVEAPRQSRGIRM